MSNITNNGFKYHSNILGFHIDFNAETYDLALAHIAKVTALIRSRLAWQK